ncbi:hypothetical protein F5883DRAFT_584212 [Diaporthe sp. PMI_573]|nr:hypothetical protein F5883DRAFT_584212 [Diaporthaceae sp. PMI_573]
MRLFSVRSIVSRRIARKKDLSPEALSCQNSVCPQEGECCRQRAAFPCPPALPLRPSHAAYCIYHTKTAHTAMMNRSIKAATPGTSLGRNHGLKVEQRDSVIASKQPGLDDDSADSNDEELPAFGSDEFMKLAHLWCESMCLLSTTVPLFPLRSLLIGKQFTGRRRLRS